MTEQTAHARAVTDEDLDVLWRPLRIGEREIANRIMVSAHGTSHDPSRYAAYLGARAHGGAGLIVTGAIPVHPTSDLGWFPPWEPSTATDYERLAGAVHEHDGVLFGQLHHYGPQGTGAPSLEGAHAIVAASAIPSPVFDVQPRALPLREIPEIVDAYADTAYAMQRAGFDGVEVHAAHGYLLHTFLSPLLNRRTDAYGGGAAQRARIVIEVGRAVRARVGAGYPIGLKLTFEEFVGEPGLTPAIAAQTLALIHAERIFDYVSISGAAYHALHQLVATMESGQAGHLARHAQAAKQVVGDLPVMVTGAVHTLGRAAEIVAAGQADAVGMVRAHLADPDIVRKAQSGRAEQIRPCVGANQGCWRRALRGQQVTCTVNPESGREASWGEQFFAPVERSGHVVVIGGGPGGLKAAESAVRRGHRVTLLERSDELGGQLRFAARLPGRERWLGLVHHLRGELERGGVDVRLQTEASVAAVRALDPDAVVVATGATWERTGGSPLRPDRQAIPGADAANVLDPMAAIDDPDRCGQRVVVVDDHGNYLGLGLAQLLAQQGRAVEFVTAHPQPGALTGAVGTVDFPWVYPSLVEAGVRFSVNRTVAAIDGSAVRLAHAYGGPDETLEQIDAVVLCMSRRPEDALFLALEDAGFAVERVGDCVAPREVDDAVLEGARSAANVTVSRHPVNT